MPRDQAEQACVLIDKICREASERVDGIEYKGCWAASDRSGEMFTIAFIAHIASASDEDGVLSHGCMSVPLAYEPHDSAVEYVEQFFRGMVEREKNSELPIDRGIHFGNFFPWKG